MPPTLTASKSPISKGLCLISCNVFISHNEEKVTNVRLIYIITDIRDCLKTGLSKNLKLGIKAVGGVLKCDEVVYNRHLTSKEIYQVKL